MQTKAALPFLSLFSFLFLFYFFLLIVFLIHLTFYTTTAATITSLLGSSQLVSIQISLISFHNLLGNFFTAKKSPFVALLIFPAFL